MFRSTGGHSMVLQPHTCRSLDTIKCTQKMHFSFKVTVSYLVSLRLTMLSKAEKNLIQCLQTQSIFISDLVHIIAQNFRDYPFKLYRRPRLCFHKDILSGHSSFLFLCDDCLTLISVDNSIFRGGGLQNQAI